MVKIIKILKIVNYEDIKKIYEKKCYVDYDEEKELNKFEQENNDINIILNKIKGLKKIYF
jgi:hypothetical protein